MPAVRLAGVPASNQDMTGKTVVFTGGTDGMGRVAAEKMAGLGASMVLLGRNREKSLAVVAAINKTYPDRARFVQCDMASLQSVRACAEDVLRSTPRIDVLVNCAGANFNERMMTEDGFECCWQVNHLGPFLLTMLLLDRVRASAPARIVNLSSAMERYGHINLEDLQMEGRWSLLKAYGSAKLAMGMCTKKLSKDLQGTGVTVNALNPGFIRTNLLRDSGGWKACIGRPYMACFASPAEVGADRIITMSVAPQYSGVSGEFVYEDEVRPQNKQANNEVIVEKVWNVSCEHVKL